MYANGHAFAGIYFGTEAEAQAESKLDLSDHPAFAFGPVVERALSINGNECDFLNFRSGKVLRHHYLEGDADDSPTTSMPWVRENGVDAGFCGTTDKSVSPGWLMTFDMGAYHFPLDPIPASMIPRFHSMEELKAYLAHPDWPAKNGLIGWPVDLTNVWNDLTPDQVQGPANDVPAVFLNEKKMMMCYAPAAATGTFLFSTRDGDEVVMQITGFTENPRGVKIRYKLVQNGNANPASGQNGAVVGQPPSRPAALLPGDSAP
jgi:hypothetical protein